MSKLPYDEIDLILHAYADRVAGAVDNELTQQEYSMTKQAIVDLIKNKSFEWRIEQMRRVKPMMGNEGWNRIMDELLSPPPAKQGDKT
jgi:hypothetical protein